MIEYDILDDYLEQSDADVGAAELHGSFSGALCARGSLLETQWQELVFSKKSGEDTELKPELFELLKEMYQDLVKGLNDSNLGFELILPDEMEQLDYRVNALGEWCNGFLFGLSAAGVKDIDRLPDQVSEVIEDFLAISQISAEGMEVEEAEEQIMEVSEYIRVGVLLVNEELQPQRELPASMQQRNQLH